MKVSLFFALKKLKYLFLTLGPLLSLFFEVIFDPLLCQVQLENNSTDINQPMLW